MSKNKKEREIVFQYDTSSNEITVNGEKKYLSIVLWQEGLRYEDVKQYIVE